MRPNTKHTKKDSDDNYSDAESNNDHSNGFVNKDIVQSTKIKKTGLSRSFEISSSKSNLQTKGSANNFTFKSSKGSKHRSISSNRINVVINQHFNNEKNKEPAKTYRKVASPSSQVNIVPKTEGASLPTIRNLKRVSVHSRKKAQSEEKEPENYD